MSEQRDENLELVRRHGAFDVVVVGGGINGIGVYRELALQGLRVLLIERNDFCSGCSAAPSRMIHGGLRYLENGEFDLVRESLRERDALLANAPHLVRPLPTTIPISSVFSGMLNGAVALLGLTGKPARRGALPIKIGLTLYDWTTRRQRRFPAHSFRGARETLRRWPELSPRLRFSATYYDAWISHPERLGLEMILDTNRLTPESVALNYAGIVWSGDHLEVRDPATDERIAVEARMIVNATGAWLDESLSTLTGRPRRGGPFVSGTKGSHVVLDCPALYDALDGHMIFFENADGRVCIVFPYLGKVLAGSTDIRVEKADRVRCEPEERDYILEALKLAFPRIALSHEDVVFSYSGIRPLPRSNHAFTGRISRGHFTHRVDGPIAQICMVGGKWTTFRAFAEQTADEVLGELVHERIRHTFDMPIGGGAGYPDEPSRLVTGLMKHHGIDIERAGHLVDLYGTRAEEVLGFCSTREDDTQLDADNPLTGAEIVYLIRREYVARLSDLLLRRTPVAIRGDISAGLIEQVAAILARELGWDDAKTGHEIGTFTTELSTYHGVSAEMLKKRTRDRRKRCA